MKQPVRIQRKRTKGWKMPPNTKYVGRTTQWGNPFEVEGEVTPEVAIQRFALHLHDYFGWVENETKRAFYPFSVKSTEFKDWLKPLKGKNLACWCPLDKPCHADILLKIANV